MIHNFDIIKDIEGVGKVGIKFLDRVLPDIQKSNERVSFTIIDKNKRFESLDAKRRAINSVFKNMKISPQEKDEIEFGMIYCTILIDNIDGMVIRTN